MAATLPGTEQVFDTGVWVGGECRRRVDKEWPRPRNTRHCCVLLGRSAPVQGFVVAWRRHSYRYSALVAYVELTSDGQDQLVQRWTGRTASTRSLIPPTKQSVTAASLNCSDRQLATDERF